MNGIQKILICLLVIFLTGCRGGENPYGVFIGVDPENSSVMEGYQTVVIDAAYYSEQEISDLQNDGKTVYSYFNVGSLENFRPYYERFSQYALGAYSGWPGEYWMDITAPDWQDFVVDEMALALFNKGIGGLFIDNFDVYYVYSDEAVYTAAVDILDRLKQRYGSYIVLNGADTFVERLIKENRFSLIDAVNQECVFTAIDFDNDTLLVQQAEDTRYFMEYLEQCAETGLCVFLTEYTKSSSLSNKIKDYCEQNGFAYYISPDKKLDGGQGK